MNRFYFHLYLIVVWDKNIFQKKKSFLNNCFFRMKNLTSTFGAVRRALPKARNLRSEVFCVAGRAIQSSSRATQNEQYNFERLQPRSHRKLPTEGFVHWIWRILQLIRFFYRKTRDPTPLFRLASHHAHGPARRRRHDTVHDVKIRQSALAHALLRLGERGGCGEC